jgi:hypothetical protein
MSGKRRHSGDEAPFSLDSFLDIVTNVVGVLVLVAIVTVVSAGNISVPSGATAMTAPQVSAERALFHCVGDRVYFVDEEGNGKRVLDAVSGLATPKEPEVVAPRYGYRHGRRYARTSAGDAARHQLVALLNEKDVGDETYRVRAEELSDGLAWLYSLRDEAHGERAEDLDRTDSGVRKHLAALGRGGFAYFVVNDDSFEAFKKAREVARAMGVSVGWHPVEGKKPLRLSAVGSLGKRVQ